MSQKETEVKYEITMYKLLGIFGLALLAFLIVGFLIGEDFGQMRGIDIEHDMKLPAYCTASSSLGKITVRCNELADYSAEEMCNILSTPIKEKIRVVVIAGDEE